MRIFLFYCSMCLAVDFFNEVNLIWDIVNEIGVENVAVGAGFPPGFEYRWADSRNKSPTACSGPQYVQHVISWVEGEINNEQLFPTSSCKCLGTCCHVCQSTSNDSSLNSCSISQEFSQFSKGYLYSYLSCLCNCLFPSFF